MARALNILRRVQVLRQTLTSSPRPDSAHFVRLASSSANSTTMPSAKFQGRPVSGPPADLHQGFKFFGNPSCPFTHRASWAAAEKKADIDYILVPLGKNKPAWYAESINRYGGVPAAYDNGKFVVESLVLAEYLEEKYASQGTSLLPKDVWERSLVRLFIAKIEVGPFFELLRSTDVSKHEELKQQVKQKLANLEKIIVEGGFSGPFLLGDRISLAELALVPLLYRLDIAMKHFRKFDLLPESDSSVARLRKLFHASIAREGFKETTIDAEEVNHHYAETGIKTLDELSA